MQLEIRSITVPCGPNETHMVDLEGVEGVMSVRRLNSTNIEILVSCPISDSDEMEVVEVDPADAELAAGQYL